MENENQNIENTSVNSIEQNFEGGQNIIPETNSESVMPESAPVEASPVNPVQEEQSELGSIPVEDNPVEPAPVESIPSEPVQIVPASSPIEKKKGNKKVFIILGIVTLVIIALALGAIFILPNFLVTGKKALEKEVTTVFDMARDSLDDSKKNIFNYDLDKDSIGLEGSLTIESDYANQNIDLTKLKDYKINYSGVIDKKSNAASLKTRLVKNTTDLIAIDGYIDGKTTYLSLGDLFNKVITVNSDEEIKDLELSKTSDIEDIKKLLDKTEESIKKSIKEENIKEEKVDGLKKITYKFKAEELEKFILNSYLEDPEIIKILANTTAMSEEDIKDSIKEEIEYIDSESTYEEVTLVLYLKGIKNEFTKTEIITEDNKLSIEKENDTYKFINLSETSESLKGEFNLVKGTLEMTIGEDISLKIKDSDEKATVDIDYNDGDQAIKINAVITNKIDSNKQVNKIVASLDYMTGNEEMKLTITNDLTLEKNKQVEKNLASTESVYFENLTDAELEEIENKLLTKLEAIMNDIIPVDYSSNYDDDLYDTYY